MARILKKQRDATEISTSKMELVDPSNFGISGKFVLLVQDIDGNSTKSFYLVRKYFLDFSEFLLFIGCLLSFNCINSFKNFRKWTFIFFINSILAYYSDDVTEVLVLYTIKPVLYISKFIENKQKVLANS